MSREIDLYLSCLTQYAFAVQANASSEFKNIGSTIHITRCSKSHMVHAVIIPTENILNVIKMLPQLSDFHS